MIKESSFTQEWVAAVNGQHGLGRSEAQLKNFEKAIMALHLLEQLSLTDLPFIFKGGTSLLLLLQEVHRFSVDIDIMVEPGIDEKKIVAALSAVMENSTRFAYFQKDPGRGSTRIQHFRFYYKPFVEPLADNPLPYILLDVAKAANPYTQLMDVPIRTSLLDTSEPLGHVSIPSADCLLADKLTAFAPETIGVPITAEPGHRPKRVEALKQLFDVSNLFDICTDLQEIRQTYHQVATQEAQARGLTIAPDDALKDTLKYALLLGNRDESHSPLYEQLSKGIPEFRKFVANRSFSDLDAARCAGKIAYLVRLIRATDRQAIERFSPDTDMSEWHIPESKNQGISDLKMLDPEAYFYWCLALA
ncbi:MAG: nucleotidyl transferase AbiEii/AbiGii toxin family protein [Clostridiales bacterium]|nr:nucleotidyl transferase AbiEii/AbiGii toxin family protein [Clostridiales bacterium]